jgi:hypothetical protein
VKLQLLGHKFCFYLLSEIIRKERIGGVGGKAIPYLKFSKYLLIKIQSTPELVFSSGKKLLGAL